MSPPPEFSPKQRGLFKRLLFGHNFEPGTKEHIARYLNGRHATGQTRRFVDKMILIDCLLFIGERPVLVGERMAERRIYDRDRKRMKELWKKTEEFEISFKVADEDSYIVTDDKRLLEMSKK